MKSELSEERAALGDTAKMTVRTVGDFGAMMLPFANRDRGADRINASLRTFAKPGTWFAPMWALLVGAVAGGATWSFGSVFLIVLGMIMAGPLLCGFSQVVNDWFDRDVDRINEPDRPTAANVMEPRTVFLVAAGFAIAALVIAALLPDRRIIALALGGILLALAYSAPPLRLKARNGWLANAACAFSYEGFAWIAGAAIFDGVTTGTVVLAVLYSLGTHGLMTLNDFKSYEGDKKLGLRSLPVMLGREGAIAAAIMMINTFQLAAIAYVGIHRQWWPLLAMALLFAVQLPMQRKLESDPQKFAPWYCASAIPPFVWGMLAAAFAVRSGGF
jgi:chlorophyll synthase